MSNIFDRTSVRKYTDEKVSPEQIELLLKAAMAAPSARNVQPWEFLVVQEKSTLIKMAEFIAAGQMLKGAAAAIVVCADTAKEFETLKGKNYWIQDCSAATQNIMLEATELGLGSVWLGTFPKEEVIIPLKELFNLPENIMPVTVISIGYPDGEVHPKDKFDKTKIHFEKW